MSQRKAVGSLSTARHESDEVKIVSGVFNGYTTGAPICVLIDNADVKSKDYSMLKVIPRPSHADYTAECKYSGFSKIETIAEEGRYAYPIDRASWPSLFFIPL